MSLMGVRTHIILTARGMNAARVVFAGHLASFTDNGIIAGNISGTGALGLRGSRIGFEDDHRVPSLLANLT